MGLTRGEACQCSRCRVAVGRRGKGKIVDWLSERADIVARFQGGHNAGHTLVIDGTVYKLSLLLQVLFAKEKFPLLAMGL